MNKLGNALYEIHHMDMLAAKDQWVNRLHPLVKLVLTIVFLTVTMSFQKYDLTGLLRMGIYPIVLFIVGEISFCDSIRRHRIVLPLVCFVGLFNPIFDRQVYWYRSADSRDAFHGDADDQRHLQRTGGISSDCDNIHRKNLLCTASASHPCHSGDTGAADVPLCYSASRGGKPHDPGVQSARAESEGCSFQGMGNTGRPAASAQHGPRK